MVRKPPWRAPERGGVGWSWTGQPALWETAARVLPVTQMARSTLGCRLLRVAAGPWGSCWVLLGAAALLGCHRAGGTGWLLGSPPAPAPASPARGLEMGVLHGHCLHAGPGEGQSCFSSTQGWCWGVGESPESLAGQQSTPSPQGELQGSPEPGCAMHRGVRVRSCYGPGWLLVGFPLSQMPGFWARRSSAFFEMRCSARGSVPSRCHPASPLHPRVPVSELCLLSSPVLLQASCFDFSPQPAELFLAALLLQRCL